jgi:hypothetical protein
MSAVPVFSVEPMFAPTVRQLRLLEGGDVSGVAAIDAEEDTPTVVIDTVFEGVAAAQFDRSLADHLRSLAATHTCFCCGAAMSGSALGSVNRCGACGAETEVIVAA